MAGLALGLSSLVLAAPGASAATTYSVTATIPVNAPFAVAVDQSTDTVYVANNNVSVINGSTNAVTDTITGTGGAEAVAVDPSTHTVYAVSPGTGTVSVIDESTNAITATVDVGMNNPTAVAVDSVTHNVYVASTDSNTVSVIDGSTKAVTATVGVGSSPSAVAVDPITDTVYVADQSANTVSVIDGSTNAVSSFAVGVSPSGVAVDPITDRVYVANQGDNTVSVIDGSTGAVTTVPVGARPSAVAVDTSTHAVYVANQGTNSVSVIDGSTGALTATVGVGSSPSAVAVDTSTHAVYVANTLSDNVSVITPTNDSDLALANVPSNITTDATSPSGAAVAYTAPTPVDEDGLASAAIRESCSNASGFTFPIGTTTVTCAVSDLDDSNSPVTASFTVTVKDTDLALANVPSNITTDATSPSGAAVAYTAPTPVDEDGLASAAIRESCSNASGFTFPIGTTTVTCAVSDLDDSNSPVTASFTVTVKDTDLAVANVPSNITTDATSPSGAAVAYTAPTPVDEDNPASATVSCSNASGSTFPIGTTTVTCAAKDSEDSNSPPPASFTVTVRGAASQLSDLYLAVQGVGPGTSLADKVLEAQLYLAQGNVADTCTTLSAFIHEVHAHPSITSANQLIADASRIKAVLGCSSS